MQPPASDRPTPDREIGETLRGSVDDWLAVLAARSRRVGAPPRRAVRRPGAASGYRHTLREIGQQPLTWLETAARVAAASRRRPSALAAVTPGGRPGADRASPAPGSSLYAGECLSPALQARAAASPCTPSPAGEVLTHPADGCLPRGPYLIVSFARSGNSPESCGVLDSVRERSPQCRHLVITCNRQGRLATRYRDDPRRGHGGARRQDLRPQPGDDQQLHEHGAGRPAAGHDAATCRATVRAALAAGPPGAELLLELRGRRWRASPAAPYRSAVYLGSGCRYGSARESALKMLEMTGGRREHLPRDVPRPAPRPDVRGRRGRARGLLPVHATPSRAPTRSTSCASSTGRSSARAR